MGNSVNIQPSDLNWTQHQTLTRVRTTEQMLAFTTHTPAEPPSAQEKIEKARKLLREAVKEIDEGLTNV